MLSWYRGSALAGRRAFWAAFGGWALEAADAQMFGLVLPVLLAVWNLTTGQGGVLAAATLVCTAVGGWLAGAASDRWGRVLVLQVTIVWYAVATALIGFSQGFDSLLVLRCLQGFGFGGEWAAGAVLISEYVTTGDRGRVLGAVQSGWAVGWALALGVYTAVFSVASDAWGWRVVFWLGLVPALLVVVLRRGLSDPPVYGDLRASGEHRQQAGLGRIFRPGLLKVTAFGALLGLGSHGGYYALTTFLPTYLRKVRGLSMLGAGGYLAVFIAASFLGYLASGWLSDRIGRRNNIVLFAVLCVISLLCMLLVPLNNIGMLLFEAPLGFFSAGIPGGLGAWFAELFPTSVRGSGQGFCYNLGRIVSAAFPALVGSLSTWLGLGLSIALFAGTAYGLAVIAAICLPDTRRRGLPDVREEPAEFSPIRGLIRPFGQ